MALFLSTAVLALIASLAAAVAAEALLTQRIPLLGTFFGLQLSHNPGIAFGLHLGALQDVLIFAALAAVTVLAVRTVGGGRTRTPAFRTRGGMRLAAIGYGLIVGGALGNIVDRLLDGTVTDFIQVGRFPIFNVADSCITVGVLLVLAASFTAPRPHSS